MPMSGSRSSWLGLAVVGVVLGDPPAEADPDQQVGVDQADQVVGPAAAEDLAVAGVVAEEAELGGHDGEVGGGEQLPPGLAEEEERDPAGGQQGQVQADPGRVPPAPPVQQAGLLELPGQLGVLVPSSRGRPRGSGGQGLVEAGHSGSSGSSGRRPGSGSHTSGGHDDRIGLINSCTSLSSCANSCRSPSTGPWPPPGVSSRAEGRRASRGAGGRRLLELDEDGVALGGADVLAGVLLGADPADLAGREVDVGLAAVHPVQPGVGDRRIRGHGHLSVDGVPSWRGGCRPPTG